MIRFPSLALIGLVAAPMATLRAQSATEFASLALERYAAKSDSTQKKLLKQLRAEAEQVSSPLLDALRAVLVDIRTAKRANSKSKLEKTKKAKSAAPAAVQSWRFPAVATYRYGLARIEPVLQSGGRSERQRKQRRAPVELLLLGMLPDADLAAAYLEARMDTDRSADDFMLFLELWRNGDESFYEALDRTAGTQDSVFFYDAMLGDYVSAFGRGKTDAAKQIKKSLDAAHDALHESFLRYRQYRAFREALALSMVLPPDVPLPAHLRRYEEKGQGQYSLRQQATMVLAVHDYDPRKVAALVAETAPPLPKPLWSAPYDPYEAWRTVFERAMPAMLAVQEDTTAFLRSVEAAWLAQADALRQTSQAMIGVPGSRQ